MTPDDEAHLAYQARRTNPNEINNPDLLEKVLELLSVAGEHSEIDRADAIECILKFGSHPSPDVRASVVSALWNIGTPETEALIRQFEGDKSEFVLDVVRSSLRSY